MAGIKYKLNSIVTEEDKIRERWQEYFTKLLNIENEREQLPKINKVQGPVQEISKEEVVYAIKQWELIFEDDIALLAESEEELQEKVQRWLASLIRGGLKMSAEKSEVLVSERKGDTEIKVEDANGVPLQQVGSVTV